MGGIRHLVNSMKPEDGVVEDAFDNIEDTPSDQHGADQ
jgi:hypothetical protein